MSPTVEFQRTCTARTRKLPAAVGAGQASESEVAPALVVAEASWTRSIGTADDPHCAPASRDASTVTQATSRARGSIRP